MTKMTTLISLVLIHLMSIALMFTALISGFITDTPQVRLEIYLCLGGVGWYFSLLRMIYLSERGDYDD